VPARGAQDSSSSSGPDVCGPFLVVLSVAFGGGGGGEGERDGGGGASSRDENQKNKKNRKNGENTRRRGNAALAGESERL
jgi:hypothetical protein